MMKFQYNLPEPKFQIFDVNVQKVTRPQNYRYSFKNGREKHGFIYITSGALLMSFSNFEIEMLRATKGEMIFVPKGSVYNGVYLEKNTTVQIVQFDIFGGELPAYLSLPTKFDLPNSCELFEPFFRPIEDHTFSHPFYYLSHLYQFLWEIDKSHTKLAPKYKSLQPALTEIIKFRSENKKVSYYADLCNLSEPYFRKLFCEYTGMSPVDYRNDLRLTDAKNKLQSGDYNVSDAAYASGFTNLSFFIRLYKKKYGHTPKNEG